MISNSHNSDGKGAISTISLILLTFMLLSKRTVIYMWFLNLISLVIFERQDLFGLNINHV